MRKIPETIVEVEQPRYKGKLVTMYNLKKKKKRYQPFLFVDYQTQTSRLHFNELALIYV